MKKTVNPWGWQEAYGYQQAVELSGLQDMLICSGQTPNDDEGAPVLPGDMAGQIEAAFDNIEALFVAAGWSTSDIAQMKIYTTDMDRFMAESDGLIRRLRRDGIATTQTLIGVSRLAFPEMLVEIEVLAVRQADRLRNGRNKRVSTGMIA